VCCNLARESVLRRKRYDCRSVEKIRSFNTLGSISKRCLAGV